MGTLSQTLLLAGLVVALSASALFVEYAPPLLGLVLAVAAAVGWCAWLDRHPTA